MYKYICTDRVKKYVGYNYPTLTSLLLKFVDNRGKTRLSRRHFFIQKQNFKQTEESRTTFSVMYIKHKKGCKQSSYHLLGVELRCKRLPLNDQKSIFHSPTCFSYNNTGLGGKTISSNLVNISCILHVCKHKTYTQVIACQSYGM